MEFDFSTNQEVEDINTVPEQFRGAYAEGENGKFAVSETAKPLVEAVVGLNKSLSASRKDYKTLKGTAVDPKTLFSSLGDFEDADAVKAHIQELTDQVASKSNIDPKKIKADIEKAFATEREELTGKNDKMKGTLEKYLIKSDAASALAAAKGNSALLLPHVMNMVKVVEDEGEYVVRVLDDQGDWRGDGKGGYMTVADLVTEMKASPTFGAAFESEAKPGTGKKPGSSAQPARTKVDSSEPTSRSKISAGLAARRGR